METILKKESNKMSDYILEIKDLRRSFGDFSAVKNVSLEIEKGDVFGFLGPNGAGKTTTIRMILGLIQSDSGEIRINGYNIKENFMKAIESVGAVVETPRFYEYLTGYQNLKQIANLHENIQSARIYEVIEIVGLRKRADDKVKNYSLGMKQRFGIARALLNEPDLIILDEPTNGLDPQGMKEVRELIRELARTKDITFFISTHLLNEVEQMCNKVAILKQGEIIISDSVSKLLDNNKETVEIIVSDTSETIKIIKKIDYAEVVEEDNSRIMVELDKGMTAQLNALLLSKGIDVKYLIPRKQSLEDYFLEITQDGDLND